MNVVNKVNIGERYKRVTFTTYPRENKPLVNVVNVVRKYFGCRARELPILSAADLSVAYMRHQNELDELDELAKMEKFIP